MFREITLGQYYPADSKIHRLDPRTKLFGTMIFIISLFIADNVWGYGIATAALILVIRMTRVPVRFILRGLKAVLILLLISVSFNLFLTSGQVIVKFWIFQITEEGVRLAVFMAIRLIYLVVGSSLMTLTTTPNQLTDGLEKGLGFLKRVKVPVHDTWGVLMRKDAPLADKEYIQPQDLWDKPLIVSAQKADNWSLTKWFERDYAKLNIVATYNLVFNASLMVEEGLGYALCFDQLINVSGDSPLCFRPLSPNMRSEASIIWKRYQVFSKASECFLQQLKGLLTDQETENSPETV